MTRDECRQQAMRVAQVPAWLAEEGDAVAEKWLAPYDRHDATVDPGLVPVDSVDPDTGQHRTVMQQIHPPRPVAPFNFGVLEVQALAREIRRELKLR